MVVAIPALALLVLALAVPNYLAIRYAVFGGSPVAPVAGGSAALEMPSAGNKAARKVDRLKFARRGYLLKALSPLIFAVSIILGLGLGGALGLGLVGLAALLLVFGFLGWDGYVAGQK